MQYRHSLPSSVSFTGKGLLGYTFGPLNQKDIEIYYVEVSKGHDVYMISKKITRTYYILSGVGYFTIGGDRYDVSSGMLVEVPPKIEYCYSGTMTLLALSKPRWFNGNDTFTKWNPDVVDRQSMFITGNRSWLTRMAQLRIFGKSPINAYLRVNQRLWDNLPTFFTSFAPMRLYGDLLHALARKQEVRAQAFATLFLRNRPVLELIRRLVLECDHGATVRVAVLGCSTGAEPYSVAWTIRSARPDLKLVLYAMDISERAVEVAKEGVYPLNSAQLSGTDVCEVMSPGEIQELFHQDGASVTVKSWIKEGISWHVGDAGEPETRDMLGPQDMVIANNFLCHMDPSEAERCLRNIAELVRPEGYLFVSGIDLDVRTMVAQDSGWEPQQEMLEEIHEGDPYMRKYWPGRYAGLEPLNKKRRNWRVRYAAVFRIPSEVSAQGATRENDLKGTRQLPNCEPAVLSGMGHADNLRLQ